jgi:tetratricopeptide (TPR) repeat protein
MNRLAALALLLLIAECASQPARTDLSWSATVMRADAYYNQGQMYDALPLYEELLKKEPKNPFYAGRLAFCLLSKFEGLPTGKERTATIARAKSVALRAKSLGDNSNLTQMVLDRAADPDAATNQRDAKLHAAEELFARGDMDAALAAYKEIAAADPASYEAHLFAGDVYFRKRNFAHAGEWFQKAIQIDPNRETAYRYWGDALVAAGDNEAALPKFIDGVIAEPYNRKSWVGLSQWAQRNASTLKPPSIPVPAAPAEKDGKSINIDANVLKNPDAGVAWLVYSVSRASWLGKQFRENYPDEKKYRHSLAEEAMSLKLVATMLDGESPDDAALRTLLQLDKDGMLEAYILLSAPDDGIAQDYEAYRKDNREILRAYLQKHVVKRNSAQKN